MHQHLVYSEISLLLQLKWNREKNHFLTQVKVCVCLYFLLCFSSRFFRAWSLSWVYVPITSSILAYFNSLLFLFSSPDCLLQEVWFFFFCPQMEQLFAPKFEQTSDAWTLFVSTFRLRMLPDFAMLFRWKETLIETFYELNDRFLWRVMSDNHWSMLFGSLILSRQFANSRSADRPKSLHENKRWTRMTPTETLACCWQLDNISWQSL